MSPQHSCNSQPAAPATPSSESKPWLPAGVQGISSSSSSTPACRPASAGVTKAAVLAQLKAELSVIASSSNLQLQSLRPSGQAARADASAELQAQVLDATLTYTQARSAAAAGLLQQRKAPAPSPLACAGASSLQSLAEQQHATGHLAPAGSSRDPEALSTTAAQALSDMKQWAIDKELSMMEPATAARYASKALAAHVGMLQSEALVLQHQRQAVEAELEKLKAQTTAGSCQQQQQERRRPQSSSPEAWADAAAVLAAGSRDAGGASSHSRRIPSDADSSGSRQDVHSSRDAQQHSAAPSSMQQPAGSCCGQLLQLAHVGLRRTNLDKVQAALLAARVPVEQLDLSSNLLTDSAVFDLVELLQSLPAAASISHLSLAHNQLLTWQCCAALRQLVSTAAAAAAAVHQGASQAQGASADDQHSTNHAHAYRAVQKHPRLDLDAACSTGHHETPESQLCGADADSSSNTGARQALPASWGNPQPSFRQLTQPLQLHALRLPGVAVGDKGAALLAEALAATHHLQVLDLSHCELNDAGGAAICSALQHQDSVRELRLSWNALSSATAQALEGVVRRPLSCLSRLFLSHCSLSDQDGAFILNALVDTAASRASCQGQAKHDSSGGSSSNRSSSNSSSSQGSAEPVRDWELLDLAHNALEGGAAVCARALLLAEAEAQRLASGQAHTPSSSDSSDSSSSSSSSDSSTGPSKRLILDGNPLGASGVLILMRAIAAQPPINVGSMAQPPAVASAAASQPVFVSIGKVSLLGADKGFRASMRAAQAAEGYASQVPSLTSAVAVPDKKRLAKGISKAAPGKPSPVAAAPASSAVVKETAAGFNLLCPAGQYCLSLQHPAAKHLFGQLVDLRAMLQQAQQQAKAQQQAFQQLAAAAQQDTAAGAATQAAGSSKKQSSRRVSRAISPTPPGTAALVRTSSSQAAAVSGAVPSRRGSQAVCGASGSSAGKPAAAKPRQPAVVVEMPSIVDLRLDGKATKLEQLLRLSPWYQARPAPQAVAAAGSAEERESSLPAVISLGGGDGSQSAGGIAAASSSSSGPSDSAQQRRRASSSYRTLAFGVKAAAVLVGKDPPVMPARLLEWAVQVLQDSSCGEMWKLQLVHDWLVEPPQAVQLLRVFDRELGQDEQLLAAGLLWAHLVQPTQLWEQVLPATLRPSQQQQLKRMLGPALMALDRQNLTGPFSLDLSSSVHRAVAWRLQMCWVC